MAPESRQFPRDLPVATAAQDSRGSACLLGAPLRPRRRPHGGLHVAATDEPAAAPADAALDDGSPPAGFATSIKEQRLQNAHVRLTVEVPAEAVEEMFKKEVEWWRKKTDVPGFRKSGKKGQQVWRAWTSRQLP